MKFIMLSFEVFVLSIIVAYDKKQGIGIDNNLPWKLSYDLKNFKKITENNYIVMGRKTFESIGKALPKRRNIILSRQANYSPDNQCIIVNNIKYVLQLAETKPSHEIFIIGGAEIYKEFLPFIRRLYITEVHTTKKTDVFFPKWEKTQFKRLGCRYYAKNKYNEHAFEFTVWEKL